MTNNQADHEDTSDHAAWASMLRRHFVALDVTDSSKDDFRGDVSTWSLGHLKLARVHSLPQTIERSQPLVRADHASYLQVGLMRAGKARVEQDGRSALLGPGDFVVYETSRPFSWALRPDAGAATWQLDVFTWPRDTIRLGESESQLITATAMGGAVGLSAVISRMLRDLMVEQPALDAPRASALADEIGDLLSVLTSGLGTTPARHSDAALVAQIERYINEHLDDPSLTPDSVARAHAVSVRQLHRLFALRQHTVARTIRSRRLEMCRRELVAPTSADRSITDIACRWGFSDLGAFGRAFRETFGTSARSYRSEGVPPAIWSEE